MLPQLFDLEVEHAWPQLLSVCWGLQILTYLSLWVPTLFQSSPCTHSSLHLKGPQGITHLYPLWINYSPKSLTSHPQGACLLRTQNHSLWASPVLATLSGRGFPSWVNYTDAYLARGPETVHQQASMQPLVRCFLLDCDICAGHHVARQRTLLTSGFLLWNHSHPHGSPTLMASSSLNYCQSCHLPGPLADDFGDAVWAWVLERRNSWMRIASQTPVLHPPSLFWSHHCGSAGHPRLSLCQATDSSSLSPGGMAHSIPCLAAVPTSLWPTGQSEWDWGSVRAS